VRQLAHAQIVDDEQPHGCESGDIRFARAVECGVGDLLDQRVRLAIEDAVVCGVRASASPDTIRHTKAMQPLQAGIPLITIKDFLGHLSLRQPGPRFRAHCRRPDRS